MNVVDTRGSGGPAPIWLLAVVGTSPDRPVPMVAIEPTTEEVFGAMYVRMRRGGFSQVNRRQWDAGAWGLSRTAAVDVVRGDLVRITTGRSSFYTAGPMPVTDMWLQAARATRALVALIVPGTLAQHETDEQKQQRLAELADRRQLLGTMAPVRFDLPVSRPS